MMSSPAGLPSPWGWDASAWDWGGSEDDLADELIVRLSAEFAPVVNADTVTAIVQQCRRDLDATPPPPPEAVEQLARQRLHDKTGAYAFGGVVNTGSAAGSSAQLIMRFLSDMGPDRSATGG